MEKEKAGSSLLLNLALAVLGVALLVLLYAFVTGSFLPRNDPGREENPAGLVGDIIQVEVRNGCGRAGVAAETTRFLRQHGFDVVEVGDHSTFDLERSAVVDRVGDLEAARKVAGALGIAEDRVLQEIRPDYYLDASVLIGLDYERLKPFEKD